MSYMDCVSGGIYKDLTEEEKDRILERGFINYMEGDFSDFQQGEYLAMEFMLGLRPAGGEYSLRIDDDSRFKGRDYAMDMELMSEGEVIWRGKVSPEKILKFVTLSRHATSLKTTIAPSV